MGKALGLDEKWVYNIDQAGRQLRRELRPQRRPGLAAQDRARPQQAVDARAACSTRRRSAESAAEVDREQGESGRSADGHRPSAAAPRPAAPWHDPGHPRLWSSRSSVVAAVVAARLVSRPQHHREPAAPEDRHGFGFLEREAGFEIGDTLIAYSPASTYARAILRRPAQHAEGRRCSASSWRRSSAR